MKFVGSSCNLGNAFVPDGCVAAMNDSSHLGEETPVHSPVSNIVPMDSQYQQPVLHSDSQQLPSVINLGFGVQQQPLQHIHEQGQFAVGSLGPMCGSDFQQLPSGSVINPGFDQQQQPLHDRSILPSQGVGFQMHSHDSNISMNRANLQWAHLGQCVVVISSNC